MGSYEANKRLLVKQLDVINLVRCVVGKSLTVTTMEWLSVDSLSIGKQLTVYSGIAIIMCITWKLIKIMKQRSIPVSKNGEFSHRWKSIGIITHTAYCSVCESLIVDGLYCDSCGICADYACHSKANKLIKCKTLSVSSNQTELNMKHHWIRGNLPINSFCDVCKEECGDSSCLLDYRCCWCQITVHQSKCIDVCETNNCEFGAYRRCIVPPFCVIHKKVWFKGRRKLVIESVRYFENEPNWSPIIVITNRKSGNNDGDKILTAFRGILNPLQVIDLNEISLESSMEWCSILAKSHQHINVRIIVAGGDGTIGWVLNTIEDLKLNPKPFVGILPLGTGNDLSKVLGWGQSFHHESSIDHIMHDILNAKVIELDRWRVKLTPARSLSLGIPLPSKTIFMNNYFSVGVDAFVAFNFHQTRESKIYNFLFSNRFFNKILYLTYGTKDVWERKCKKLNEKIKLELDGRAVELPELESIIVLNISSWGGGADLWNTGSGTQPKQKINDKIIEVLGVYSSLHIGQLMIGLSEPLRFGRANTVKIQLLDRLPIQVDGEPWLQYPTTITIDWHSHASMLTTNDSSVS